MPRLVAFLRAINVGGHTVRMAELVREVSALGAGAVETFLASGNVVFRWPTRSARGLEARIESRLRAALGYVVATFVRTDAEVAEIAACAPFGRALAGQLATLNVGFLKAELSAAQRDRLLALESELDRFAVRGREVYWGCRVRQSESKFSNVVFERRVGVSTTFRGLNTLVRLAAKLAG